MRESWHAQNSRGSGLAHRAPGLHPGMGRRAQARGAAIAPGLPQHPDCAWLLLTLCASPRANHAIRTVPPTQVACYAAQQDQAIWETLQACLGVPDHEAAHARQLATLPADMGGLGLQSAQRTAPAAYWAAWMDALPILRAFPARSPAFADRCLQTWEGNGDLAPCLQEAADAR